MKKRTYLSAGLALLIGTLSVHASPGLSDVKSRVLPAVYKSKNGLTQKVEISVKHEGEPSTVTIHLGEQSHKEKLVSGDNVFRIEIPEVSTTRQLPLTLTSGKEKEESTVTVKRVRHWQINMVQHTIRISVIPVPKWKSWQNSFDTLIMRWIIVTLRIIIRISLSSVGLARSLGRLANI